MNMDLDEDQRALQESLARWLAKENGHEQRRVIAASPDGFSEVAWHQQVELGLTALTVDETYGGLGVGAAERFVVMQQVGANLLVTPLLATCWMPAAALGRLAPNELLAEQWLPRLAEGTARLAWAHDEADGDGGAEWVRCRAEAYEGGWRLSGRKVAIPHAAAADALLVSARVTGQPGDAGGRALFVVERDAVGVQVRAHRLIDASPAAEIVFDGAIARPVTLDSACASQAIQAALDLGCAAACAEMVGTMQQAFQTTLEYAATRKQFGKTIGEYQAVRHRLADMKIKIELAHSLALAALIALDDAESGGDVLDIPRAKALVGRWGRLVCEQAIQLHGGIGMTEEYVVGHHLKRALVLEQMFGDEALHVHRLPATAPLQVVVTSDRETAAN